MSQPGDSTILPLRDILAAINRAAKQAKAAGIPIEHDWLINVTDCETEQPNSAAENFEHAALAEAERQDKELEYAGLPWNETTARDQCRTAFFLGALWARETLQSSSAVSGDEIRRQAAELQSLPELFGMPGDLHFETKRLLQGFFAALAAKLYAAQSKYGYTDGWRATDWMDECRDQLRAHMAKGDPRDVAAYCAFLWWHNESTVLSVAQREKKTEQADSDSNEIAQLRGLLQEWEIRVICPQCGQRYHEKACGPTHAVVWAVVRGA